MRLHGLPLVAITATMVGMLSAFGCRGGLSQTTAAAPAEHRELVLEGGTLIDGTGRGPIRDAVVVIDGARIKAVGQRGKVQYPPNATVLKLNGLTVLPGLMDAHIHLQDWQLPMFLPWGVTTVADNNSDAAWILAERDAVNRGKIKGAMPRLWAAGSFVYGAEGPYVMYQTPPAHTVEEARDDALRNIAAHVDLVKVGGNTMSDEQLRAIVEVANAAGLTAMGHTKNILRAAEVGEKFAEHSWTVANALLDPDEKNHGPDGTFQNVRNGEALMDPKSFPPLIRYMVDQGVFFNPTLFEQWSDCTLRWKDRVELARQLLKDQPKQLDFVPSDQSKAWLQPPAQSNDKDNRELACTHVAQFIREYSEAGGKIIVGTDTGPTVPALPGLAMHYEMQMLVDWGVAPMRAIQGATLWNAQMLKKDIDYGSIEPGKVADFLVIDGDPLADIGVTKNVRMVIKDGAVINTTIDPNWVNPLPESYSVTNKPPQRITDLSPRMAFQGDPSVTVALLGNEFTPNAVVRFDNQDLPTHFVSSTQLTATIDAQLLQRRPGSYALYVVNTGLHVPGLGASGTVSAPVYILVNSKASPLAPIDAGLNPKYVGSTDRSIPQLYGLTPRMALQDGPSIMLTIKGEKFTPKSVVRFDNSDLPTHFLSSTQLTATLDASFLQRHPGGYVVYVVNPGPHEPGADGGTVSAPTYFLVNLKDGRVLDTGIEN